MNINSITNEVSQDALRGQKELSANIRRNAQERTAEDKSSPGDSAVKLDTVQDVEGKKEKRNGQIKPIENDIFNLKAIFALDDEKNVIIKFLDDKGETVKQFPPEEYLNMVKRLNEVVESIYSRKV